MGLARILVDGYSLLHRWPELAGGRPRHSQAARDALIQVLTQYQDATGKPITIVFDGAGAHPNIAAHDSEGQAEVIFSRKGKSADQVIERLAYRFRDYGEVLVVTNDRLEAETASAVGALIASCDTFIEEVEHALDELTSRVKHQNTSNRRQFLKT